jgi:anti-anti-sigma regulatory factor
MISLDRKPDVTVVQLEGDINIRCAAELKQVLLEALACGGGVQVSLEKTSEVDITTIQLLWAGRREAEKRGVGFSAAGPVPERVACPMRDAGLEIFSGRVGIGSEVRPETDVKEIPND